MDNSRLFFGPRLRHPGVHYAASDSQVFFSCSSAPPFQMTGRPTLGHPHGTMRPPVAPRCVTMSRSVKSVVTMSWSRQVVTR
ncbi:hypothetical protein Bpfe_006449 [Biomphalaria pfeifferi]|uniref:Uncharacterized protein n=1 Tax=Biomphalaria pfeifferi TaxID=112525 RepID=A0AAD8FIE0_BIOPF|nr:hypothetical protein Bpfe_006449 [Biomphalaria pfeifferi]